MYRFTIFRFGRGHVPLPSRDGYTNQFNEPHLQGPVNQITSLDEVDYEDNIYTGQKGPPSGEGSWYWYITWNIKTKSNKTISLGNFRQQATSDNDGKAVITKGGYTQSSNAADPTHDW